jgi:hypothetical protein
LDYVKGDQTITERILTTEFWVRSKKTELKSRVMARMTPKSMR